MGVDNIAGFLQALRDVQVLDPGQLDEIDREASARAGGPDALADRLCRGGLLTPFQAERLLGGHGRELVLGPYLLLEPIGEGGMGRVFKARHRTMKRLVALKVLHKERLAHPEAVPRFFGEIEAASRLSHPNVVIAHDAAEVEGTLYFAMEYIEGTDLAALVRRRGPIPAAEACEYARQAALGLQHIHEQGLVHRDIKPSNLLRADRGGVVKILDLGLARLGPEISSNAGPIPAAEGGGLTRDDHLIGTPDYLAPEQASEPRRADIRADIYGLGCTLYHLLAGTPPYPGGSASEKVRKHREIVPVPLLALCPDLPPGLATVVATMMAGAPERRFQEPGAVAEALAPFATATASTPAAAPVTYAVDSPSLLAGDVPSTKGRRSDRRTARAIGLLLTTVVGLSLAGARFLSGGAPGAGPRPGAMSRRADAHSFRLSGELHSIAGRDDAALSDLTEAIRLDPEDSKARTGRAWVYFKQGRFDSAFADLDEAIRRDPTCVAAYDLRGWLYLLGKQYERAIADCDRVIQLDPSQAQAFRHRAQALAELGRFERAAAYFDRAIRLDPSLVNYEGRAAFRAARLDLDGAIADFDAALQLDPARARAYHGRGLAYDRKGETGRAIADFDAAIGLEPDQAQYYVSRGQALARSGELARAETDFRRAELLDDSSKNRLVESRTADR